MRCSVSEVSRNSGASTPEQVSLNNSTIQEMIGNANFLSIMADMAKTTVSASNTISDSIAAGLAKAAAPATSGQSVNTMAGYQVTYQAPLTKKVTFTPVTIKAVPQQVTVSAPPTRQVTPQAPTPIVIAPQPMTVSVPLMKQVTFTPVTINVPPADPRADMKNLCDTGQSQLAAQQLSALIDTDPQKAAAILETYNADGTETHLDKTTASALLGAMVQNGNSANIDKLFQILDPEKVSNDLQAVCADLMVKYPNVCSFKSIVWSGVSCNYDDLKYASAALKDDKDVVMAAIMQGQNGWNALAYAGPTVRDNQDVIIAAMKKAPMCEDAQKYASDRLKGDSTIILVGLQLSHNVHDKIRVIQVASTSISNPNNALKDEMFIKGLINSDFYVVQQNLQSIQPTLPANAINYYQNTSSALQSLGLYDYSRFTDTKEIIRNRYSVSTQAEKDALISLLGSAYFTGVSQDTRPVCIVTTPDLASDYNGAFTDLRGTIDPATKAYKVIYYNVHSDTEFANSIKEATIDNGQKAQLLIICGHGSFQDITLGDNSQTSSDALFLDTKDNEIASTVKGAMADKGIVIDYSCSNGEFPNGVNTSGIDNIAEFIHYTLFPNAYCYANQYAGEPAIKFDANGFFSDVTFYDGDLGTAYYSTYINGLVLAPETDSYAVA